MTTVPCARVGTPIAEASDRDEGHDRLAGWRDDGTALVLHLARDGKRLDLLSTERGRQVGLLLRKERRGIKVFDLNFAIDGWRAEPFRSSASIARAMAARRWRPPVDPPASYDECLYRSALKGGALRPVSTSPGVHLGLASPSGRSL